MIAIEKDPDTRQCRYILSPNQSMTWRELKLFFMALCGFSFSIAGTLSWLGYWPILPFAGLEMLAVGAGLYVVARRGHSREIISIDSHAVLIERGYKRPQQRWSLSRIWAKVVLEEQQKRWYPSRLSIRCQGSDIEIGRFLNEYERQQLASELCRSLGRA